MRLRILGLVPTLSAAVLFAGCGGADQEISANAARALVRGLDTVEQGVRAGECKETQPTLRRLSGTVRGLPDDVDPEVRATLDSGVERLERLVEVGCKQRTPKPVEEEPEQPIAPPPVETAPEAPPTTTEPPVQTQPEPEEEPIGIDAATAQAAAAGAALRGEDPLSAASTAATTPELSHPPPACSPTVHAPDSLAAVLRNCPAGPSPCQ